MYRQLFNGGRCIGLANTIKQCEVKIYKQGWKIGLK